jgi:hypothetical protein
MRGEVSGLKTGWMFWLFVLFVAGFARYVLLALLDDDRPLVVADTLEAMDSRYPPAEQGLENVTIPD